MKKPKPAPLTIKSIKSKGYSPSYEARLIRAVRKARAAGKKPTRQGARGHKPKEHIERAEKERAKVGITSSQREAVVSFLNRFNSPLYKGIPDYDALVDYIKNNGYQSFVQYRTTWDKYRRQYLKAQAAKELGANGSLGYKMEDIIAESGLGPPSDEKWLYYH